MGDCAVILHTQLSEMNPLSLEELGEWHKQAVARASDEQ
ncbi:MAG: GpE family phage tail protein [Pseudomonadota bacterium]